ncbi:MAG: large-conductance mechanosensitive channel protein MscL [Saprospiraceae bacterium]|jgi:large conductance mechanosensitive channel
MLKEFKEFALKGNLIDIAVGFVMGAAFGKVSTAFTQGIISPLVGMLTGGVNFADMKMVLKGAVTNDAGEVVTPEVAILYGDFITAVIDFIIVAFVMFMVIRAINNAKKKEEAAPAPPPAPSKEEVLLTEIRDLLKK